MEEDHTVTRSPSLTLPVIEWPRGRTVTASPRCRRSIAAEAHPCCCCCSAPPPAPAVRLLAKQRLQSHADFANPHRDHGCCADALAGTAMPARGRPEATTCWAAPLRRSRIANRIIQLKTSVKAIRSISPAGPSCTLLRAKPTKHARSATAVAVEERGQPRQPSSARTSCANPRQPMHTAAQVGRAGLNACHSPQQSIQAVHLDPPFPAL